MAAEQAGPLARELQGGSKHMQRWVKEDRHSACLLTHSIYIKFKARQNQSRWMYARLRVHFGRQDQIL